MASIEIQRCEETQQASHWKGDLPPARNATTSITIFKSNRVKARLNQFSKPSVGEAQHISEEAVEFSLARRVAVLSGPADLQNGFAQ